jgi:hypothetical protein
MNKLLGCLVIVLTIYSMAVTHRLGVLEGKEAAWASVSEQVETGTLELK